jgi:hypothetical protein
MALPSALEFISAEIDIPRRVRSHATDPSPIALPRGQSRNGVQESARTALWGHAARLLAVVVSFIFHT